MLTKEEVLKRTLDANGEVFVKNTHTGNFSKINTVKTEEGWKPIFCSDTKVALISKPTSRSFEGRHYFGLLKYLSFKE